MDLRKIGNWAKVLGLMSLTSSVWGQVNLNTTSPTMAERLIPIQQKDTPILSIRQSATLLREPPEQFPNIPAHIIHLPSAAPHAFFCRMETLIEKNSSIPFIFRLGDVDQVNRLEGKTKPWIK